MFHLFPPADHPHLGVDAADIPTSVTQDDPPLHPAGEDDALMMGPGGDRASLRLRPDDEALIAAAAAVSDQASWSWRAVPWLDTVPATLLVWYPGLEGGHALADVLVSTAEPAGRLAFAIPLDEDDLVPFDNTAERVTCRLLHGLWWLDDRGVESHLPFGFAKVTLDPGATRRIQIRPDLDQLRVWLDGGWVVEDAPVDLPIGEHAHDERFVLRATP